MSSTDPSPTPPAAPGRPVDQTPPAKPPSSRGNPAFSDIARSMLVIGAIVIGLFVVGQFFMGYTPEERPAVAYEETVEGVRKSAPFPVYAPTSLPDGWRANGVTYEPGRDGRWHLGVLTDGDRYIGLEQEIDSVPRMVERYASGATQKDDVEVAGKTWQLWTGDGETAFVREEGEMTLLVGGPAPRTDIERYLELLTTE
ncbi:DUF4245 domain-containing protein [Mumia sp. zg.B53]|uniref:DUF4245 domain-containing protein n=1 Tax=unclassified Mumia TaxID=2621872 RepID=UPI001C6E0AFD|nr:MULTISPECIES: DUF4245 domain-containing protein [unclassified Mumia]MBW9206849.1 DUF4245 domain-containing protein [Mumia sp. zg.B17]MBW9215429.1 DUF4245 domain-containing protein [Mumia sp. zg.B53]MDD9349021.1 DUF4245 domain-containing protein [Mumia sp.]